MSLKKLLPLALMATIALPLCGIADHVQDTYTRLARTEKNTELLATTATDGPGGIAVPTGGTHSDNGGLVVPDNTDSTLSNGTQTPNTN